jgi:dynein heavy chain
MILSTGEIPNLIAKDDRDVWLLNIKTQLQKQKGKSYDPNNEQLWEIFINRVRDDLHLVLCFSPMGEKFQQRAQNFPSLFNECSINWFLKWPEEALVSVAEKFISAFTDLDTEPETKLELQNHMGAVHLLVDDICDQYLKRMRRSVFVTPKSYLSFIGFYKDLYLQKYQLLDTDEQNFTIGLAKIAEAQKSIAKMGEELAKQQVKLDKVVE